MSLPGHMDALISAVSAANHNTVVCMQSGTPVAMPWISQVPALIQAWFGGNETGNAIADVLFGDVNPSAKLPLSFPISVKHNPAYLSYRSERGRTLYGEDVYIGYRYYEALEAPVLFPFGHGLSYTSFSLSGLSVQNDGTHLKIAATVTNTGSVAGAYVLQVYVAQQAPSIARAPKELKAFEKVFLAAGASQVVESSVETKYASSFWDERRAAWIMEKGEYRVIVADSSSITKSNSLEKSYEIEKTVWWNGL